MTTGVSLSPEMASMLFDTACDMLKKGSYREVVNGDDIEGEVRTDFEEQTLGSIGGIEFHATVETNIGTGSVKYLVRPIDVARRNRSEWVSFASVDELIHELNSPPSRRSAAYN